MSIADKSAPARKPARRKKSPIGAIVATVLTVAAVGGGYVWNKVRMATAAAATATQYKTTTASVGRVKKTVSASGTLQPWRTVDIKSRAGGEVKVLAVEVGDSVTGGQLIARIDPTDPLTTYRQATADLDSAVARRQKSSVSCGLHTDQTRISIQNAEASLASSRASLAQSRARLATARAQSSTQPALTRSAIAQAQASYDQSVRQRKQLDVTNPAAVVEQNVTSVHVRVEVDNSSPTFRLLKPGMNATCAFVLDSRDGVANVPSEAIHEDDEGKYVETSAGGKPAKDDPTALVGIKRTRVPVETGLEGNDAVEITSGLKGDETIVTQTIEPTPEAAGGSPFGGAGGGRGFGGGGVGGGRGGR